MTRFECSVGAAMITIALLISGCSTDSAPPTHDASAPVTPQATATPAEPQIRRLDEKELDAALLELDALPAGWSEDTSEGSSNKATYCDSKPSKADLVAERSFEKGGGLDAEVASTGLAQYASADIANKKLETLRTGMKACKSEKVDGETRKYAIMNTEDVGYPSLGWKISTETYTVMINIAQVGPTLIQVGNGGILTADADLTGSLLTKQVDAYVAAAS